LLRRTPVYDDAVRFLFCNETLTNNDNTTDPAFVSTDLLLPDFRLRAPSPLIDAGDPADPLTVDLLNAPRPVDGDGVEGPRSDMGAYEYQRQPPHAAIVAPSTATIGAPASFSAAGSSDPDPGDVLTFSWDFGDGGTAEGFAPQHTYSKGGTFAVKLTVTDPTGLSSSATAQVQVPAAAGNPPAAGKNPKPKKPKKPKNPKAVATITELRAVPKRIKRGKGLPKLVNGLKRPGFQFNLSKKGDVTLTLARCKGRRGCKKRARVPGAPSFKAAAGQSTIKFRGRLTGPKLRKGRYRATLTAPAGPVTTTFRLI
jgi:PKD domain